jgi:hypothetical protein
VEENDSVECPNSLSPSFNLIGFEMMKNLYRKVVVGPKVG